MVIVDPENPIPENLTTEKTAFLIPVVENEKNFIIVSSAVVYTSNNNKKISNKDAEAATAAGESESSSNNDKDSVQGQLGISRVGCLGKYTGIILALISGVIFSLGSLIVKYMKGYHPFSLALYRFQGILLPSVPLIAYSKFVKKQDVFEPIWPLWQEKKWKTALFVAMRGFSGCSALLLHFYALQHLNVADALVIGSTTPVFVTFVAHICLGETCGVFPIFVAGLTILGVGVITRPPILTGEEEYNSELLAGTAYSLCSMLLISFAIVIIRYLKNVHFAVITFVFGSWGTIQCLICAAIIGVFNIPQSLHDILLTIALAACTFIGQTCITLALKYEQAGLVSLVRTVDSVSAFFWQFIFLGVVPDIYSLVGASIVIFSVLLSGFRKWLSTLPHDHPARQTYFFVLK